MYLIINITRYFKVIFILAGTSHGGYNDYTYEDLFNFLVNNCKFYYNRIGTPNVFMNYAMSFQ